MDEVKVGNRMEEKTRQKNRVTCRKQSISEKTPGQGKAGHVLREQQNKQSQQQPSTREDKKNKPSTL